MTTIRICHDEPKSTRRATRRAVQIPCELVSRHVDQPLLYWATDLTPYGAWLDTRFPMETGEVVVVSFQPPVWWPGRELMLFAEVSRSLKGRGVVGGSGMGVQFTDITVHEQRALLSWLRGRPPRLPKRRLRSRGPTRILPLPRHAIDLNQSQRAVSMTR